MADVAERGLPPVTFSSFVISLAQSTLVHLGESADPGTGAARRDLPLARHTFGLLTLLQEKTKGNLDDEEQKLIDQVVGEIFPRLG